MAAPIGGETQQPRRDGYLRLNPSRRLIVRESLPAGNSEALLFIDLDGVDVTERRVLTALQEVPQRLTHTRYIIFRYPNVTAIDDSPQGQQAEEDATETATAWATAFSHQVFASSSRVIHVGVVRFRVGKRPRLDWADDDLERLVTDAELLQRALQVEVSSLLELGHAIWRPTSYHYQLPSGQHAASFIRVADAFRSPRDVRVFASWLTPDMRDGQAIVADSATLVPLITDIHALSERRGWVPGRVEMLDEYPRTKLDLTRVIRPLAQSNSVMAIMSVNSSGRYLGVIDEALRDTFRDRDDDWVVAVVVDKTHQAADRAYRHTTDATDADVDQISTWISFTDPTGDSISEGACAWCKNNTNAQVVQIDPRTFEALALPGVDKQMPSYLHAQAATGFWNVCFDAKAVGVAAQAANSPSIRSRPEKQLMSVVIDLAALLASDNLAAAIHKRVADERKRQRNSKYVDFSETSAIVVSDWEAALPHFDTRLAELFPTFNIQATVDVIPVDCAQPFTDEVKAQLAKHDRVLLFALGTVSGWNLRQLLLGLQETWEHYPHKRFAGLVLHSRPPTKREWANLRNSYQTNLDAVWQTYFPWRDPLDEEHVALRQLSQVGLDDDVKSFIARRIEIAQSRHKIWTKRVHAHDADPINRPNPAAVLWGGDPHGGMDRVRNMSLYGTMVDALTAYVAIGAAIHATRQERDDYDPRWLVFDMPAITRSYYDGIIVASILRWLEPQETWWGRTGGEAESVMSELLARTVDVRDRKVLIPELLYAASLGKVHPAACTPLLAVARTEVDTWPTEHQAPTKLGILMLERSAIADPTI